MTWVKLDDQFFTHPKSLTVGPSGQLLFIAGLCYSAANLTDGKIPKGAVTLVVAMAQAKPATVKALESIGWWIDQGDHFEIHDYLLWQVSRQKATAERERARKRKADYLERQRNGVPDPVPNGRKNSRGTALVRTGEVEVEVANNKSSSDQRGLSPTADGPDGPDDDREHLKSQVIELLADRRADLEHHNGEGINQPDRYRRKLIDDHRQRFSAAIDTLADQQPHWDAARIADNIDPQTAAPEPVYADEILAEHTRHRAEAAPMPDDVKELRKKLA